MRSRSFATAIGLVVLLIGLVFVFVGVSSGSEERALARRAVVAQGLVSEKRIDHVTRHKKGGGTAEQTLHLVRYRFVTRTGVGLDGEQAVSEALWRRLQQDGPIAVRYLEANPFVNRADAEPGTSPDLLLAAGSLLTAGGFIFLVVVIHGKRGMTRTGGA
jgi:hypothetical protein